VRFLATEAGCKIDVLDKFRRSPVHWACRFNMSRMVEVLNELGVFIDSLDSEGQTPTDIARFHRCLETFGVIKMLV
jgi:ankyrin repeat protein